MTAVILDRLWLNRTDTGEAISALTEAKKTQQFGADLDVRTYANGRRRAVSTVGEVGELPYILHQLTLPTVTTLRSWVGVHMQARDIRGQKWFGVFAGVQVTERFESHLYAASITLLTVTTVEGV